jgi:hypothetical protein
MAQERPDFSGTWTAETDPAAAGRPVHVYGAQFSVDHKGSSFLVTRTFSGGRATIQYVLDGAETTSRMPGRLCEPDSGASWTAAWEGQTLAINMTSVVPPNGKPVKTNVKGLLRLEAPDTMRVEVTMQLPGQQPRTNTTIYKRTGPPPPAASAVVNAKATLAQVAWIAGVWVGGSGTSSVEERWTPPAGGAMLAVSRTLRDGNMNSFEFLCLVERDGGLVYQAMPNGRMPATDFTLTRLEGESATFENPAHDYPKVIRYTKRPDGTLEATISAENNQRARSFVFKRQE